MRPQINSTPLLDVRFTSTHQLLASRRCAGKMPKQHPLP
jgi:hypothetical protein